MHFDASNLKCVCCKCEYSGGSLFVELYINNNYFNILIDNFFLIDFKKQINVCSNFRYNEF